MRTPIFAAALLAFVLTACQPAPPPAPAADVAPILDAVAALDQRTTVLAANVDVLSNRVTALDERLMDRLRILVSTATDLHALMQQPLRIDNVDLASIDGLVITTTPDAIDFLLIAPGACPDDLPGSRTTFAGGELLVSAFWPAPTGVHCISSTGGEDHGPFGAEVNVPPGTVGSITLLPPHD